jgi:glycine/D-amino acid oxidase-like deaminating enzyme
LRDIRKRIYHNKFSDHLAVEILGFAELNERLPAFHKFWDSCTNGGALWYPKDFWIDPPSLLAALDAALRMLGASFLEETVTAVNGTPEGRFAVVCQRQTLEFDYVALAAGAGIGAIEVGSQSVRLNFLSPVPGWTYEIEVAETCHPLSISEGRMALNAFGRNIRLGSFDMGKLEHALGSDIPSRLSQQISGAIGIALPSLFFEGKTATDLRVVSGTRVLTPDRWPIVGPFNVPGIPVDKLWILTGFHKVGFYLADMAARGMVQFLEQGSVGGFFPYFSPRRFFPRLNV